MGGVANTTKDKEIAQDGDGGDNLSQGEKNRIQLGDKRTQFTQERPPGPQQGKHMTQLSCEVFYLDLGWAG